MKTLALARDLGSSALDFGWEHKKTVLAVIGGIALVAVAGVVVARLMRKRAEPLGAEQLDHAPMPPARAPHPMHSAMMATASKY